MKDVRLTNSNIRNIPPSPSGGSKLYRWDLQVRGFGAYKTKKGRICFVYQYKTPDKRTTSTKIGEAGEMSVEHARDIAAGYARKRRAKEDPLADRRKREEESRAAARLTISTYFEEYRARRAISQKPISAESERTYRRDLLAYLGDVRLDRLTPGIIEDFGARLAERGPSVVRIGWGRLKTLINDAVRRGTIVRTEAHDFELPSSKKRKLRLSDTEFLRVYEACRDLDDVRADVMEMILRTAKRKEEVAELPWEELDLARGEWRLPAERTKPRRNALILLPRQVVELLERQQPDPAKRQGPVFTLNGATSPEMGSQVRDLVDANLHRRLDLASDGRGAPFPHWTVHDTRKVPSSILREPPFRYSRDVVNAILVHKVGDDLDETYMLTELVEEAGEALQKWNDRMDEIISRPDAFPGGRELPSMRPAERAHRTTLLREHWPQRADQKRAAAKAAADPATPGPGGAAAARKRRDRAKAKE